MADSPMTELQRMLGEAADAAEQLAQRALEVVGAFVHDHRDDIDGFLDKVAGHRRPPED